LARDFTDSGASGGNIDATPDLAGDFAGDLAGDFTDSGASGGDTDATPDLAGDFAGDLTGNLARDFTDSSGFSPDLSDSSLAFHPPPPAPATPRA
jgi:hypothetical protein